MKKENDEVQSRRDFFKKAAKAALPILGGITLLGSPLKAIASNSPTGCNWGCDGSCWGGCKGCSGGCTGGCNSSCESGCTGSCKGGCLGGCMRMSERI